MEAISYTTWDDALGSEEMKKRLEFLSWYALNEEVIGLKAWDCLRRWQERSWCGKMFVWRLARFSAHGHAAPKLVCLLMAAQVAVTGLHNGCSQSLPGRAPKRITIEDRLNLDLMAPAWKELPDVCYEGEFLYGLRHGKGKHTYQGEVYEGSWLWGQRHGKGVCIQTDGTKVIGSWKDGKLEGAVTIEGKTGGTLFEGEFKAGKRDGFGRQVFPNGDTYAGGWKDGIMHDRGVYHFANGDHLEGIWHEGKYHGPAYFRGADGSVSRRVYQNGVLLTCQEGCAAFETKLQQTEYSHRLIWEDYFLESQKFSKEMSRDVMQKHTALWEYPKHALE
eukprot:g17706.t1